MILTSDLHLTAHPDDSYRWDVFQTIDRLMEADDDLYILGDITDRRDRHPAELVNRLVSTLTWLVRERRTGVGRVTILCGNHDKSLYTDMSFWSFLNHVPMIRFIDKPTADDQLLLMPYSHDPAVDWADIDLTLYRCAFMHQSVTGAVLNAIGRLHESKAPPIPIPPHLRVYSGDIHIPQIVGPVEYVGAPHHVRFGDDHQCRILRIHNQTFDIVEEILLNPPAKIVANLSSMDELQNIVTKRGDKVVIHYKLPIESVDQRPQYEALIAKWAKERGVVVSSVDAQVDVVVGASTATDFDSIEEALIAFAESEGIDVPLLEVGVSLLDEWQSTRK